MVKQFYLTIDRTISDSTTPNQSEPGRNGNEEGTPYSQSPRTEATTSDGFVSLRTLVGGEISLTPLPRCSRLILQPSK